MSLCYSSVGTALLRHLPFRLHKALSFPLFCFVFWGRHPLSANIFLFFLREVKKNTTYSRRRSVSLGQQPSGVAQVLAVGGAEKGKKHTPFVFLHTSQCLIFCPIFYLRCGVHRLKRRLQGEREIVGILQQFNAAKSFKLC